MKRMLESIPCEGVYHYVDGKRVAGLPSWLSGNVTGLSGNVTGLRGNVTELSGNVTGLRGDVTELSGNVDECEITGKERKKGIDIKSLVK